MARYGNSSLRRVAECMYYSYVLKSLKDHKLYIGSTEDLETRLKAHNSGKVRSTKSRRPLILLYKEELNSVTEARKKENFLKSDQGRNWLKKTLEGWPSG